MEKGRKSAKRIVAVLLTAALMVGGIAGGTYAWLISKTDEVVNTFSYGDINISIEETDTGKDGDSDENTNTYKMMPGETIGKDPKITVEADNEACWLYVKLTRSVDPEFDKFMTYDIADGWYELTKDAAKGEYVYFRYGDADTDSTGVTYPVIKDNSVTVKSTVTKEMFDALTAYPTLKVKGYAMQYAGFEVVDTLSGAVIINPSEAEMKPFAQSAWEQVLAAETGTNP